MERSPLTVSLFAPNVSDAVTFYVDRLGFRQTGSWSEDGKPPVWAEVSRGGPKGMARIWFFSDPIEGSEAPSFSGLIYLFVENVDAEAARLGDGPDVLWGPEDQAYGLRELGIRDLNGYRLCLAQDM
jgi:catechol 2,3-dioxygenase-like lactoylglutathione lyase family enzyme